MPATDGVLQYGALGILFVVLIYLGKIGWDWLQKNGVRMEKQDSWMRQLMEADRKERAEHLIAWREMVGKDIETREAMNGVLVGVCDVLESHVKEERKHHAELMEAVGAKGSS